MGWDSMRETNSRNVTDSDSTRKPESATSPDSADSGVTTSNVREIRIMGWDGMGLFGDKLFAFADGNGRKQARGNHEWMG